MRIPWYIFMAHWFAIFWTFIGVALLGIAIVSAIDEIRFRLARRRYRLAEK